MPPKLFSAVWSTCPVSALKVVVLNNQGKASHSSAAPLPPPYSAATLPPPYSAAPGLARGRTDRPWGGGQKHADGTETPEESGGRERMPPLPGEVPWMALIWVVGGGAGAGRSDVGAGEVLRSPPPPTTRVPGVDDGPRGGELN